MRTDLPAPARRRGPAVVAALTVAVVATVTAGVVALSLSPAGTPDVGRTADTIASSPADDVLELDQGPSDDEAAVLACAEGFADDLADVEVLYDVLQKSPDGDSPVLLLRNADGELRLCDMTGPDAPATLPLPQAGQDQPVVELTNSDRVWSCDGDVLESFHATTWLSTTAEVAEVAQRFVVDGEPGPWFSTTPVDGVAHVQGWLRLDQAPQQADAEIHLEQRALASDGTAVDTRWAGRQRVAGCVGDGGPVQIG